MKMERKKGKEAKQTAKRTQGEAQDAQEHVSSQ